MGKGPPFPNEYARSTQGDTNLLRSIYPENLGEKLSIDVTSLSPGELYTIVTNKTAKGKKGAKEQEKKVKENILDRAGNL